MTPFLRLVSSFATDRVLYTPERLEKIAEQAASKNSPYSLNDRLGLVHDTMALSRAGLAKLSSALTLVDKLKNEKECKPLVPALRSRLTPHYRPRLEWYCSERVSTCFCLVGIPGDCK